MRYSPKEGERVWVKTYFSYVKNYRTVRQAFHITDACKANEIPAQGNALGR